MQVAAAHLNRAPGPADDGTGRENNQELRRAQPPRGPAYGAGRPLRHLRRQCRAEAGDVAGLPLSGEMIRSTPGWSVKLICPALTKTLLSGSGTFSARPVASLLLLRRPSQGARDPLRRRQRATGPADLAAATEPCRLGVGARAAS